MRQIKYSIITLFLLAIQNGFAQKSVETLLNEYIEIGLENNLALKQKNFSYQKSSAALKEAQGMFLPSISIEARYSRAGGGRDIIFPIGDLVNPIHQTLNALLQAQQFPGDLPNEVIPFLREEEHDTKLRLVQPLIQPGLFYNYQLKNNLSKASMAEVEAYKSQLVAEIKTAYYKYLQSTQLVLLFEGTLDLLNENIRISQALFDNEMVTKDVIYRANSEKLKIDQQLEDARHKETLAKSYFNFLLNKPLDDEITTGKIQATPLFSVASLKASEEQALNQRSEIKQFEFALSATENATSISKSSYFPNLNLVVDYGFQGEEYRFTKDDDYWMASAVFSWNLFNGFQDKAKREKAVLDNRIMKSRFSELKNQLRMQVKNAHLGLQVSQKSLLSAKEQEIQASESFKIVSKKYEEGLAPQIEFIDARVNMTNAGINNIISRYDVFIKEAELDHVLGRVQN